MVAMAGARLKLIYSFVVVDLVHIFTLSSGNSLFMAAAATNTKGTSPSVFSTAILITVDQSGKGDFKKIQDAIDSVQRNNRESVFIRIKPGIYREKIVVPADKPFITLSSTKASHTIITWNDGGDIFQSPTLSVLASDFIGRYLTIQNTYGTDDRSVALRVSGDRIAFHGCRILSYQDTLLDDAGSHYYRNCYIEGATDFICGNAASIFERCHLHSTSKNGGSIAAHHRHSLSQNTGFTFLACKITGVGSASAYLARPWGAYSRVVFALTYMSNAITPEGWNDWADPRKQSTVFFAEYKCFGPGANRANRVKWSQSLSYDEAVPFLTADMIGGRRSWLRRPKPAFFKRGSTIINAGGNL